MNPTTTTNALPNVEVEACELPVYCPNPNMPTWSHHPRVFLEVTTTGTAMCPYCGTRYTLKDDKDKHEL